MARLNQLKTDLKKLASPRRAKISQRFFKTGSGQYGAGDIFWGLTNPQQRQVAKTYSTLSLPEIQALLKSKIHEQRQTALMILTNQYPKADQKSREKIFRFYLGQTKNINNWDLVDLSAPRIVGQHLLNKPRAILYRLARSKNLWPRRKSMACGWIWKASSGGLKMMRLSWTAWTISWRVRTDIFGTQGLGIRF